MAHKPRNDHGDSISSKHGYLFDQHKLFKSIFSASRKHKMYGRMDKIRLYPHFMGIYL